MPLFMTFKRVNGAGDVTLNMDNIESIEARDEGGSWLRPLFCHESSNGYGVEEAPKQILARRGWQLS